MPNLLRHPRFRRNDTLNGLEQPWMPKQVRHDALGEVTGLIYNQMGDNILSLMITSSLPDTQPNMNRPAIYL
jgi:hypothetical protein